MRNLSVPMLKVALVLLLLTLALCLSPNHSAAALPGEARRLNSEGVEKYKQREFKAAEEAFTRAAETSKNDPALRFNLGAAQFRNGKAKEAQSSFNSVFSQENPTLNAAAKYNAGVLQHKTAMETIDKMKQAPPTGPQDQPIDPRELTDTAIKQLTAAMEKYKSAIMANPVDTDMKVNYELARRQLEELKRQQEQQQQDQQQNQDQQQQNQDQDQKDQQQQDQQKQDQQQQNKDDQKQDQQNKQPQKDDQKQDQSQKPDEQKQDEQDKKDEQDEQGQPKPTPTPKPEGKPEEQKPDKDEKADPADSGEIKDVPIGEMSEHDVDRLLNSLPPDDQKALQRLLNNPMTRDPEMENDW